MSKFKAIISITKERPWQYLALHSTAATHIKTVENIRSLKFSNKN